MRNGNRTRRLVGQLNRAMDRSNDGILHRVRNQQGTERINTHSREPPKGPRINTNRIQPYGNPRMMNGRNMGGMPFGGMMNGGMTNPGPPPAVVSPLMNMNMTPQQQMQLFAMYEEQARMMAQILSPQQQQQMFTGTPALGPQMGPGTYAPGFPAQPQTPGRSLFERIQPKPQMENNGMNKRRPSGDNKSAANNDSSVNHTASEAKANLNSTADPSSSMEVDASSTGGNNTDPATTVCKFNLACTKEDCPYAHQSPAAPTGTTIDVHDECPFGAACKNRKCVARHPSPAVKSTHQAEQECKFFPNCTNPNCPFKHPTMPLCRNGADCTRPGCKFTHLKTACKFNPCLNPICPFKHTEGQKRGAFSDKVWTANGNTTQEHLSERKFVDEHGGEEELIIPASSAPSTQTEPALAT